MGTQLPTELVYDDILLVGNNQTLHQPALSEIFSQHLWAGTPNFDGTNGSYYRPLMIVSLVFDRIFFGENLALYHFHSILWHLLGCTLLWHWLSLHIQHKKSLFFCVSFFSLHPANMEIVSFLAARNDSMACVGILGMLIALHKNKSAGIFLTLLIALLSKESALLIPPLYLGLYTIKERKYPLMGHVIPIILAFACYFSLRFMAEIPWPNQPSSSLTQLGLGLVIYLDHTFFPGILLPGSHILWPTTKELFCGTLGLFVLGSLLYLSPRRIFGGSLFVAGLLPAFAAIGQTGLVADRYLYLPMIGLCLLIASSIERLRLNKSITIATVILTFYFAVQSSRILPSWSNNLRLFSDAVTAQPSPFRAGAYAKALEETGNLDQAALWYEKAVQPPHPNPHSCYNITWIHFLRQDFSQLLVAGEKALAAGCEPSAELTAPLALAHALSGNWDQARRLTEQATRDPRNIFFIIRAALAARDRNQQYFQSPQQQQAADDVLKLLEPSDPQAAQWLKEVLSP